MIRIHINRMGMTVLTPKTVKFASPSDVKSEEFTRPLTVNVCFLYFSHTIIKIYINICQTSRSFAGTSNIIREPLVNETKILYESHDI